MSHPISEARLAAFVSGQEDLSLEEQALLVLHLEEGCEHCWKAQAALPPSDPTNHSRLLARALLRLGSRPSWIPTRSGHLEAIRRAGPDAEPGGLRFVNLLVEEALDYGDSSDLAVVWPVAFETSSKWPALPNLVARTAAWSSVLRRARPDPQDADLSLELAERYLLLGDGSKEVEAEVERARAWSFLHSEPSRVFVYFDRSLALLAEAAASRRFEVRAEKLLVYGLLAGRGKVPPAEADRLLRAVEDTLEELRPAEHGADPVERWRAFWAKARFATFLGPLARGSEGGEEEAAPLLESLAAELEDGLDGFYEAAGEPLTGQVCLWLGELAAPDRVSWHLRALGHLAEPNASGFRTWSRRLPREERVALREQFRRAGALVEDAQRVLETKVRQGEVLSGPAESA